MLKVKCPECGSIHIDRINRQVRVSEEIFLDEVTDYVIEGAEERPFKYYILRSDENIPPYIEELDHTDLEFICECGYKFEDCHDDDGFIHRAREWGLIVWDWEAEK